MSENASDDCPEEKPVVVHSEDVLFPPFPDPTENDFDDDIAEEERNYYKEKYKDLNIIKSQRLHCTACDRHLGCAPRNESRMRPHPLLRTLVCHTCHNFYNSGEFEKGDDGSELYCRWCGQGGQVYCCSDCPHVFCARCIRRNLGTPKIKEIEQMDDWKCFKCNPKCLWDTRAMCWAVLRYCDQKNKIAYNTEDPEKKDLYQKDCAVDYTECCKSKIKKKEKKKENENTQKKSTASIISKISPAIQVKKFASIVPDEKPDKKPLKRPASPKQKAIFIKNAIPVSVPSTAAIIPNQHIKKIRMTPPGMINTPRFPNDKKMNSIYIPRFKCQRPPIPIRTHYNGSFNIPYNTMPNDNINLSLENLTQGVDISGVSTMTSSSNQDDDVVCTPDLPLESMCEVTEDNADDDVQCITPGPITGPKLTSVPPLVARAGNNLPELIPENIVQMTESDVTVNTATGGLKFRVDPQTLSSNKMYRLPDGRVFAINANPGLPGGYSATIVAVTEKANQGKASTKGATFAAKLSAVTTALVTTPPSSVKSYSARTTRSGKKRKPEIMHTRVSSGKTNRRSETSVRECDLNVPIEWYRYNLIDAVDALEYSLSRLHKLKREATTVYLRTRSVNEMRNLHRTLDRLLSTSVNRFNEVRVNVNKEMKQYVAKKKFAANSTATNDTSEEDDDVEILPDLEDNEEDPIFIDENSSDSNGNQEVDLTGANSENSPDKGAGRKDSSTVDQCNDNNDDLNDVPTNNDVNNFNDDLRNHGDKDGEEEEVRNEEASDVDHSNQTKEKDVNGDMESDCNAKDKEDDHKTDEGVKEGNKNTTNNSEISGGDEDLEKNSSNEGTGLDNTEAASASEQLDES
ncbi:Transcriptional regulator ATRX [Papilio xuthus]|uniref:Transcriptional regulator ATRX n=1 Tax=Papilio xuthus TaxID=66420 RepID=A0A194Q963_PAPXU|nr:Transcriptional regulator ATRX [Papilio xuthus]